MTVLVFASDILPLEGLPTSGGGLRSWQIIQGLKSRGVDVTFSMPGEDRFLERKYRDKIPKHIRDYSWKYENQDEIVEHFKPSFIIFANPDLNCLKKEYDAPIMSDMHGPRIVEFELLYNDNSNSCRGKNIRRKLKNIMKSDYFTCAGRWQRYYFLSFFLMAGYKLDEINIEFMPVSLSPELKEPESKYGEKRFVFSGGFYPWQNPKKGLILLSQIVGKDNEATLHIFGGSHDTNKDDTHNFKKLKEELTRNKNVHFRGYLSRDDVINEYLKGYVAFELMERNFERELAFTTRTIEFLWAGMPVIYNNYSDLSGYIEEYKAGWCVDPNNEEEIKSTIKKVINEPEMVSEYSKNAQRLVRDCFTWDKTIEPVLSAIKNGRISNKKSGIHDTTVPYIMSGEDYQNSDILQKIYYEKEKMQEELHNIINTRTWKMRNKLIKLRPMLSNIKSVISK